MLHYMQRNQEVLYVQKAHTSFSSIISAFFFFFQNIMLQSRRKYKKKIVKAEKKNNKINKRKTGDPDEIKTCFQYGYTLL